VEGVLPAAEPPTQTVRRSGVVGRVRWAGGKVRVRIAGAPVRKRGKGRAGPRVAARQRGMKAVSKMLSSGEVNNKP